MLQVHSVNWREKRRQELLDQQFEQGFETCRITCLQLIAETFLEKGLAPHLIEQIPLFKRVKELELLKLPKGPVQ